MFKMLKKKSLLLICLSLVLFLIFAFTFSSCVVTQNINYTSSSPLKGSSKTDLQVYDFFVGVVEDMYSWSDDKGDPIIDVAISNFSENLSKTDYAYSVNFKPVEDNKYLGTFGFTDFQKLIKQLSSDYPDQDLITINETSSYKELKLNISLSNYDVLCKIVPFLAEESFMVWGPIYNNPPYDYLTEDDYKELVSFILGEDGPESIDNSSVTIHLSLPAGMKIQLTNGKKIGNGEVEFTFPLIDFLLLHKPITFYVRFN